MTIGKKKDILHQLVILLIAIQPLIDMDYLFYDFLNQFGIPRLSTILRFIVIPLLILWAFFKRDTHKKRTVILVLLYGIALVSYFILHTRQAIALYPRLDLTENFFFNTWQELTYVLTMVIPFFIIYLCYQETFTIKEVKWICLFLSGFVSILIFIGDLYVFANSTYYGKTVGNVFTWFNGIYDGYHPRTLASKFFFNEGNTIGILMFMLLPMLYYFLSISEDKKERNLIIVLIFIQSMSMQMLATRVATYGAIVVPILFLILSIIDKFLLSKNPIKKSLIAVCLIAACVFGLILDFTPAIQNQKVDAKNDVALLHNGMAELGALEMEAGKDLIPGTPEYINFYVYMFETYGINARYIQSVPSMYYTEYYSYQHDPKYWCDVCFMPVFDRVSGRQIETIFFNYKYKNLTPSEKILGMGYSTFMNGSIVLEQDFKQQVYTLGYAGVLLCVAPWIGVLVYGLYQFIRHPKKLFTLKTMTMAIALACGLGSAWLSGHVLDQIVTSSFMAFLVALLLKEIKEATCDQQ